MTGLSVTTLAPILVMFVVLGVDVWVYADAKGRTESGDSIAFSVGSFVVDTPTAWFLGCLVLWIVFFPLYLTVTGRNPFRGSK